MSKSHMTLLSLIPYSQCWIGQKPKNDLDYNPQYDYLKMLEDFKKEMEIEHFAKLWNTRAYYENLYKDKV